MAQTVILASASPRRHELMSRLQIPVKVIPADVDESMLPGESPRDYVMRVAADKAHKVATSNPAAIIVAADTCVVLDGRVLPKPTDVSDAITTLRELSGRTHEVLTAVTVIGTDGIEHSTLANTRVAVADLGDDEISWYVRTGEPFDKAGSYALQGKGEFIIDHIDGSASTVIGLPLRQTLDLLRAAGLIWPIQEATSC